MNRDLRLLASVMTALIAGCASIVLAAPSWQALPTAPVAGRHDDMIFVTPERGWVVNSSGEIHRTTDAGQTWERQLTTSRYFRSIHFVDAERGLAGTLGGQLLYRTTNGGAQWFEVPNTNIPLPRPAAVCGLAGVGDTIYGVGAYTGPAVLIRSNDAGASWTSVDMSPYARNLVDCHFVDAETGFVVGGSPGSASSATPIVLHTSDGGQSWATRFVGTEAGAYCWKIFFVSATVGYVSVYKPSSASILKTTDGGASWALHPVPAATSLEGIGFVDPGFGWVDGWGGSSVSTDGGLSWQPVEIAGGNSVINRFQFFGPALGYAAGATIYRYGAPTTDVASSGLARSVFTLAAAPNPFSAETAISFTLPRPARAQVRIYDVLGREMRTILDDELPAGSHLVSWDGRDEFGQPAASGSYLYRVDAAGRAESRGVSILR